MPWSELVVVARFEIPTESMLLGCPEHKVRRNFSTNRVHLPSVCIRVNPLGANAKHELESVGKRPGLLEEKINTPFGRVTAKQWRYTGLKFKPVLYRRNLNRYRRTKAR